jgi:hypothetical protein
VIAGYRRAAAGQWWWDLLWGYPSPESYGCPRDGDEVGVFL